MTKMTKQAMINEITKTLKEHPDKEVVVSKYNIRNGRWGLHGYCISWMYDKIMAKPWAGANVSWAVDLSKLNKEQIGELMEKAWKSI